MRSTIQCFMLAAGLLACDRRGPDGAVYFRTVPLTVAASDSLREAIMKQDFHVDHLGSTGQPQGIRRGVILFQAYAADSTSRDRVVTWLRGRPEISAAGLDSSDIW